jgi:hypothetical protein
LCWLVDNVPQAIGRLTAAGLRPRQLNLHRGPRGREAAFIDPATTRGVLWEVTGLPARDRQGNDAFTNSERAGADANASRDNRTEFQ